MRESLVITIQPALFDEVLRVEVSYRNPDGRLVREIYDDLLPSEADDLVLTILTGEHDDRRQWEETYGDPL